MQPGKQREISSSLVTEIDAGAAPRSEAPIGSADASPCEGSPPAGSTADTCSRQGSGSEGQKGSSVIRSLRDEVKEALRNVLQDKTASAAAKASAGRTLMEYFDDGEKAAGRGRGGLEMTAEELDAEIARLTSKG